MKKILATIFIITIVLQISILAIVVAIPAFAQPTDIPASGDISVSSAPKLDYSGFVKCDGVVKTGADAEPGRNVPCDFAALMNTVRAGINWMFVISIPVATVLFSYAGLLYIRGTSGSREKANKIFTNVGIGFIIMLIAWFAVRTVVDWFVEPSSGATTLLGK